MSRELLNSPTDALVVDKQYINGATIHHNVVPNSPNANSTKTPTSDFVPPPPPEPRIARTNAMIIAAIKSKYSAKENK